MKPLPHIEIVTRPQALVLPRDGRLVWYFGDDYQCFMDLEAQQQMAPVGDVLNRVANRLNYELVNLDAALSNGRFPCSWASSMLAERNPLTSDFCLDICRIIGLLEGLSQGERHLVVVDDPSLGRAVDKICRTAGHDSVWRGPRWQPFRFLCNVVRAQAGAFRMLWERRSEKSKTVSSAHIGILSWASPNSFKTFDRDAYFGALPSWLKDRGIVSARLFKPMVWMASFQHFKTALKECSAPVAMISDFIPLTAMASALFGLALFPWAVCRSLKLEGFDLTALVKRAIGQEFLSANFVLSYGYSRVAATMKAQGMELSELLYPYENQPWERALILGFRHHLPSTRLIGVQHAPLAMNYFSACASKRQWRENTVPDLLVTIGQEFKHRVIEYGAPADRVVVGGTLRFPYMAPLKAIEPRVKNQSKTILVSCAIHFGQSYELCHRVMMAVRDVENVALLINFHPAVDAVSRERLIAKLAPLAKGLSVRYTDAPAYDLLPSTDLLVYAQTGVAFEAAALGIPILFVGSVTGLDLDKFDAGQSNSYRDQLSLTDAIVKKIEANGDEELAWAKVARHFTVAEEDWWVNFVASHFPYRGQQAET